MKISLKWLREYVDVAFTPKELGHRLTMAGTEVGNIQVTGGTWDNIFVGQVTALSKHPNADRLQLATIDLGGEKPTVVSGAPNLFVGAKVPFAKVGARLIDGHTGETATLKPARIRGVVSEGMACSEKELGLSESHEGIMILPPEAPLGAPLAQYLGDAILDLKVTPNRPDCLAVIGIAREVAALTGQKVREPNLHYDEKGEPIEGQASVEIRDPDLCPRYCASLVTGVKIAPSPAWMQERLLASGMRPINNVVDITNYVMLEYGQPLHAFDFEKLRPSTGSGQRQIIVRRAAPGERMTSLDGAERTLAPETLVIADGQGPVAIAGVMGGAESEVTDASTVILLESANFQQASLRRTSSQLKLRSEASLRFDKGLSPELPMPTLRRATQLLVELAGGMAARGIIDVHPGRREAQAIRLTEKRVKQVLGVDPGRDKTMAVLGSLGFQCQAEGPDLMVTPPYWRRTDVKLADDLVEEIARITGYDDIPTTALSTPIPQRQPQPMLDLKEKVRDLLVSTGMQEIITYSLTSLDRLRRLEPFDGLLRQAQDTVRTPPEANPLRVANPMSAEQEYLRTTLRAGILSTLAANEKRVAAVRLFEVGRVYLPKGLELPHELEMLAGVLAGPRQEKTWARAEEMVDFFDAKGILEALLGQLGIEARFEPTQDPLLSPGRAAQLVAKGIPLGVVGELHHQVAAGFDIASQPVLLFELDLEKVLSCLAPQRPYHPLPRFPGILRDLALVVNNDVPAQKVQDILLSSPLVREARLFDLYAGAPVAAGKKSLAFSLLYQSPSRTLTDQEVNQAQEALLGRLQRELGATLRS